MGKGCVYISDGAEIPNQTNYARRGYGLDNPKESGSRPEHMGNDPQSVAN
jgi:hypothetical protein